MRGPFIRQSNSTSLKIVVRPFAGKKHLSKLKRGQDPTFKVMAVIMALKIGNDLSHDCVAFSGTKMGVLHR